MDDKFGDFEEVIDDNGLPQTQENVEGSVRVRLPKKGEVIGVILQRYGGNRMEVIGTDRVSRNCRVPGRFKKSLWLRPKDTVLVEPWPDDNSKGDIIHKYSGSAINQLRKRGLLDSIPNDF
ncbi:MAG: translation initiation factor eIF-1A [Nanoarchaeota archaeon]